jgi:hypothetical protein
VVTEEQCTLVFPLFSHRSRGAPRDYQEQPGFLTTSSHCLASLAAERLRRVGGEIPVTGAAVVALAAGGIIAVTFRSGALTGWGGAHGGHVSRAPNDFTHSQKRA